MDSPHYYQPVATDFQLWRVSADVGEETIGGEEAQTIRAPHSLASPSAASQRVVLRRSPIKAVSSAEPQKETPAKSSAKVSKPPASSPSPTSLSKKPIYTMKKGQIVRVDKEKYLNSINYLSVGHPPFYKGLDYIYEDRGEVLDLRNFETGEHALVAWVWDSYRPSLATNRYACQVRETRLRADLTSELLLVLFVKYILPPKDARGISSLLGSR